MIMTPVSSRCLRHPGDGIDQDCDGADASSGSWLSGEIADCNGNCAPSYWVGDGTCDNGSFSWGSNSIYLDCASGTIMAVIVALVVVLI